MQKLLLLLPLLTLSALAQTANEQALLQLANQARAQHGVPPLHWDNSLYQAAQTHAQRLVREPGDLQHQYSGERDLATRAAQTGVHFTTISETLARHGQTPQDLQRIWMSTTIHRANLLDPQLDAVGIAVIEDQGLLYAVEDFARTAPTLHHQDIERNISQLLQPHNIAAAPANQEAQAICQSPDKASTSTKLVIQWDGPAPTQLPNVLLQQIATGKFTTAEVAACPGSQPNQQFTTVHVVVLLY